MHHRDKKRIQDLGEVFTPPHIAEQMLDLLDVDWSDLDFLFFEPSCGNGNIVIAILNRRLNAIFNVIMNGLLVDGAVEYIIRTKAAYSSVANTIDTMWAIDIDEKNIRECRQRVFDECLKFLREKLTHEPMAGCVEYIRQAIKWHIYENELLSALGEAKDADKTKMGKAWVAKNGHHPINFKMTYSEALRQGLI